MGMTICIPVKEKNTERFPEARMSPLTQSRINELESEQEFSFIENSEAPLSFKVSLFNFCAKEIRKVIAFSAPLLSLDQI